MYYIMLQFRFMLLKTKNHILEIIIYILKDKYCISYVVNYLEV
jgi:hypothetical protein